LWSLYFFRMLYSLFVDDTLLFTEYLYDDINKYITFNFIIGLIILSLSTYNYEDIVGLDLIFYKVLITFITVSLISQQNESSSIRADANSYIPTLLYGQYGCLLALLSIYYFLNLKRIKLIFITGFILGVYVIGIAGSRSAFI